MVVCFTSDNIRITTSPPHWFMPKTGASLWPGCPASLPFQPVAASSASLRLRSATVLDVKRRVQYEPPRRYGA